MGCGGGEDGEPPWREEHSACFEGGQLVQSTMKGAGSAFVMARVVKRERAVRESVDFMVGEVEVGDPDENECEDREVLGLVLRKGGVDLGDGCL